jgi:GNAT superfamily N-acetyltransferase
MTLRDLRVTNLDEAAQLVAYSMRDNPINVRAFSIEDADLRSRSLVRFFRPVLRGLHKRGVIVGAFCDNALVGVCAMAQPGSCQPTLLEKIEFLPSLVFGNPMGTAIRVARWAGEWARRDPPRPHWHLGTVAVSPHFQGQGIGRAMLAAFCERIDRAHTFAYLETDKFKNVGFYQRFGFRVIEQAAVLGIPNWFMSRPPTDYQRRLLPEQHPIL